MVLSFPPYSAWGLAFIGMVPFLLALFRARSYWDAFWIGFPTMVAFIWFGFGWISFVATNFGGLPWIVGQIVLLLFSFFAEAQFLIFALVGFALLSKLRQKQRRRWLALVTLVVLPIAYVGFDFAYPKIFPSAFGHVLYEWFAVAQVAEYTGVYALSVPILLVNMAIAVLVHSKRERLAPVWGALSVLVVVAIALGVSHRWGRGRIDQIKALEEHYKRGLKVSIIQANIGDMDKLASETGFQPAVNKVLGTYRAMTVDQVAKEKPDLVIWPETAFPFLYTHLEDGRANRTGAARDAWIYSVMKEINTPLYFGSYSESDGLDFNSAFLIKPPFELVASYRKAILLAFGEYIPLGPLSPFIQDIVPTIANFGRGPGPTVIDFNGFKLGPQICYEGIYPEHPRGAVAQGADIMLNITNDSWFGDTTEPWLHLALTAFRSIELRRSMIRATNTGISTIIDMTGEIRYRTRLFEPATLTAVVRAPGDGQVAPTTFYLRHGELFARICALIAALAAIAAFGTALIKKVTHRRR